MSGRLRFLIAKWLGIIGLVMILSSALVLSAWAFVWNPVLGVAAFFMLGTLLMALAVLV